MMRTVVPATAAGRIAPAGLEPAPVSALRYARHQEQRFLADLAEFVRFPSVSADPEHRGDVRECARWLAAHLRSAGLRQVRIVRTCGHPIVVGERREVPGRPTVLLYGHYDVQPPGPAKRWETPPFRPAIRDGSVRGRGTADDKGPLLAHVKAIESYLRTVRRLPVNVVCVFEGEEEIGGPHLAPFLSRFGPARAADVAIVSDTPMRRPGVPALIIGLRGLLTAQLRVRRPGHDLHAGDFGGSVPDPAQAACVIVSRLYDRSGRVAVPGFYDRVQLPSAAERARARLAAPSDADILRAAGSACRSGERGYTLYERATMRPAIVVSGIAGGGVGASARAVIPSEAVVELNLRLVPRQRPEEVARLLRVWLTRAVPPVVQTTLTFGAAVRPVSVSTCHPAMGAASRALQAAFGTAPVLLRSGGSISAVATLNDLGIPLVLMGFSLPSDQIHAANERFSLAGFQSGVAASILFLAEMGRLGGPQP